MNSFGINEAKAAGVFAKTPEQKQTVLAVVNMFGIPNVVATQIKKRVSKLMAVIGKKQDKGFKLEKKIESIDSSVTIDKDELCVIGDISIEWINQEGENSA